MLEVCVDTPEAAFIACDAGAQRIEYCHALHVGGLSPSTHDIALIRSKLSVPIIALIRIRAGDFLFDQSQCLTMIDQALAALDAGATGIAVGAETKDGRLNVEFLEDIRNQVENAELVLHRVFDGIADKESAMRSLVEIGFHRVLTSGGPNNALQGCRQLHALSQCFGKQIQILPAGGIRADNAWEILEATGCSQLHGSFRTNQEFPNPTDIQATRRILDRWLTRQPSS
jgi:copper homeostasis protein